VVLLGLGLTGAFVWKRGPQMTACGNPADAVALLLGTLLVAGFSVYGAFTLARFYRGRHLRVLVFADGFVCFRDGQASICRWRDVATVQERVTRIGHGVFRRIVIRTALGREWVFDNKRDLLEDMVGLCAIIQRETAHRLLCPPASVAEEAPNQKAVGMRADPFSKTSSITDPPNRP
jgi:hypothetical protein